MLRKLIPDPFILALLGIVLLASVLPARGSGAVIIGWLSSAMIVSLFFFHGAKLSRDAVLAGLKHWRLHLVILASTFVMFPLLGLAFAKALPGVLPPSLWTGVLFLAALPSTVQSSIAFVSIARGNVPAAIASASVSQILGVFLTPLLVGLLAGAHQAEVAISGVGGVVLLILVPFIIGHLAQPWVGSWVQRHKALIAMTDRGTILIAVYSAFSGAVIAGVWSQLPLATFGVLIVLCGAMLAIALAVTRTTARALRFERDDEITIVFCGTKKSLVQGIPMARVLFAGPDLGLILIPIMIFHQIQLMVCAWIAQRYAKGVLDE